MTEEKEKGKIEVPIIQEEFAEHLAKYRIKKEIVNTIAENIAEVGGPTVFETPEQLNERLTSWSQYIGATLRKQILDHWFAKKGIVVTEEIARRFALSSAEVKKEGVREERKRREAEGAVWTVEVDDSGMPKIRMIKDETEPGITLSQAKTAAREIGKEREEPIVLFDEQSGRHTPNFKSPFVKQNLSVAWATARQMDRAASEGETVDPMAILIDEQVRLTQLKEVMGISPETREKGTVGELVAALKDLQEMARQGKVGELPEWLSDPVTFMKVMQGEAGKPDWMSDPAKFIETVQTISGGGKGEIAELRKSLDEMREDRRREEIASLQVQMRGQAEVHQRQMDSLMDKVEEMSKPVTGRTELDIIHEVATGMLDEAKGMRGDIKGYMLSQGLPQPKTPEEREARRQRYRTALAADKEIEVLGKRLFFGEQTPKPE